MLLKEAFITLVSRKTASSALEESLLIGRKKNYVNTNKFTLKGQTDLFIITTSRVL